MRALLRRDFQKRAAAHLPPEICVPLSTARIIWRERLQIVGRGHLDFCQGERARGDRSCNWRLSRTGNVYHKISRGNIMKCQIAPANSVRQTKNISPRGARFIRSLSICLTVGALSISLSGVAGADASDFRVHSDTFKHGAMLPTSMVDQFPPNGVNTCTADGSTGGNTSPELSWENAPRDTRSFAVVMYDVTASFTHWGIYNISGSKHGLPAGSGVAGSNHGEQVPNDFGSVGYEGPCPPPGIVPYAHHYVVTVYALDTELKLAVFTNFPQNPDTLFNALALAGAEGHVLARASIGGFFSATPLQ
jgi:Raf kinase inhibitor-like YbhB/YbcL family protein